MTRLQKTSVFTLIIGLVLAVLVMPWSLLKIQEMKSMLQRLDQNSTDIEQRVLGAPDSVIAQPAPTPPGPVKPVVVAKKAEAPVPAPTPAAYAVSPALRIPMKQAVSPNGKPYRGELGVSWQFYDASQSPCIKRMRKAPERLSLPNSGGYVDVLQSRIVLRPCAP